MKILIVGSYEDSAVIARKLAKHLKSLDLNVYTAFEDEDADREDGEVLSDLVESREVLEIKVA